MNDTERRLAALEASNRRHRLGLTTSLVALATLGLAGFEQIQQNQNQNQTWPRNIVADTLTVQNLNAYTGTISQLGSNRATLQYVIAQDGQAENLMIKNARVNGLESRRSALGQAAAASLDVRGQTGGVTLAPDSGGGLVSIVDASGQSLATLGSIDGSGNLNLRSKGGFTSFDAGSDGSAGRVRTFGKNGKPLATLGQSPKGDGQIVAHTRNGNWVVVLSSDDLGENGKVTIQKQGGEPLVTIDKGDTGGRVVTLDGAKETSRLPSK